VEKGRLFCHSEPSEESLFDLSQIKEREILRAARNDKSVVHFVRWPHNELKAKNPYTNAKKLHGTAQR
jgi:hypothetical protein